MNASKRIKLDPSPQHDHNPKDADADDLEQEQEQDHCIICLQPFIDRTIVPACAHEFCFDCILLWSEQSRKCPLCSRSFDDSYLIHRIRSQYDYQKHYLPPSRSSPPPPLTGESRVNALRSTRRERQWGRRQRRQREEADELDRAIARRRWIYQHHLYAKHVASNPYTRYRPFPTPAQFAASPDLIRRMTTFLRRELRVWPNLDVEFLTTYTISLMKSIDIRSESAVKLLSEFLDLDTPYTAGARHVNAEHFAHEIYSYLRSPYRDLNMYDQSAQYDTPPEISPPQEIERGSRWSAERSPSRRPRSRSNSRYQSPVPHRENSAHAARHRSAEVRREEKPNHRQGPNRSPRHRWEDHDPCNQSSGTRHSPPDSVQGILRNGDSGRVSYPSSAVVGENQDNHFPVQLRFRGDEKEKGQVTSNREDIVPETDHPKTSTPQGDDSTAAGEAGVTRLIDGPLEGTGDKVANYVDKVGGGSSANPQPPRKRSAGSSIHPRNRTLSESVQAYLSRPVTPRYLPKKPTVSGDEQSTATGSSTTDARPSLLRLTDGPDVGELPSPRKTTVDGEPSTLDDATSEHHHHGRRSQSCIFSSTRASFTVDKYADAAERDSKAASVDDQARGRTDASGDALAAFVSMSVPVSGSTSRSRSSETEVAMAMDVDKMAALETRLRARARVRVRLAAAIKDVGGGAVGSGSGSGSGLLLLGSERLGKTRTRSWDPPERVDEGGASEIRSRRGKKGELAKSGVEGWIDVTAPQGS